VLLFLVRPSRALSALFPRAAWGDVIYAAMRLGIDHPRVCAGLRRFRAKEASSGIPPRF